MFLLILYIFLYIVSYVITEIYFIGKNPHIKKATNYISRVALSASFILFTGVFLSIILVEIREIIPIRDGILSPIFSAIYRIEA